MKNYAYANPNNARERGMMTYHYSPRFEDDSFNTNRSVKINSNH
jgi:hypothetical protein